MSMKLLNLKTKKKFQNYLLQLIVCRKLDTANFAKMYNV